MANWRIKNLLFEDNETSYNNWRGAWGKYYDWSVAGIKSLLIHDGIFRRHKSLNNQTGGFWLDTDCSNILIEDAFWRGNLTNGIFIEASQGPTTLRNSAVCGNNLINNYFIGPGISTGNSTNVALEGNVVYGNGASQVGITAGEPERTVQNWETGELMNLKVEFWKMIDNVIMGKDLSHLLIDIRDDIKNAFLYDLISDNNIWYSANDPNTFRAGGAVLDLNGWRSLTGQDLNSVFADPRTVVSTAQKSLLNACMDYTAPYISNVAVTSITAKSAVVTWTTNEPADSQLEYGLNSSYGNSTPLDIALVTNHSAAINGLSPGATYHYRIKLRDKSGNSAVSANLTFATLK